MRGDEARGEAVAEATMTRLRLVTLVITIGALSMAGCSREAPEDGPRPPGTTAPPTASPTVTDAEPTATQAQLDGAAPTGGDLGSGWSGPKDTTAGFARLDNFLSGCSARADVIDDHERAKPAKGALVSYGHADEATVLNQVQAAIGADTIARAGAYLGFLRTVPRDCPTGEVEGYAVAISLGAPRGLGEDEVSLHAVVDLPGDPLELDLGFARTGGLVVSFYGTTGQVDQYLPVAFRTASTELAGEVAGV
jgi:hypothetical protein